MKTMAKVGLVAAWVVLSGGPAWAESDRADVEPATARSAAWERVGNGRVASAQVPVSASRVRLAAPGEDRLQARKAEMVRRMFWIMLAHR